MRLVWCSGPVLLALPWLCGRLFGMTPRQPGGDYAPSHKESISRTTSVLVGTTSVRKPGFIRGKVTELGPFLRMGYRCIGGLFFLRQDRGLVLVLVRHCFAGRRLC